MATATIDARRLRYLLPAQREAFLADLTEPERVLLQHQWSLWARDNQLAPPGNWLVWMLMGGRGSGKSRTGAEWIRQRVYDGAQHLALVGKTPAEVRDVMIQNPLKSGLLDVFPPHERPVYVPSRSAVKFHTGAVAHIYSGEEPGALRGPGHDTFWCDELPKFQYPTETYDNLLLGLRVGPHPQGVVTTTPLPTPLLRRIIADPFTVLSRSSTHDNLLNLSETFKREVLRQYEGTRLERQEIYGELLTDTPGALWQYEVFRRVAEPPAMSCVVVAIDPAVTATEESDETGIVTAGIDEAGHAYVLSDVSGRYSPSAWANKALDEYVRWRADRIVCETNNGGDMVVHTIQVAAKQRGMWVRVQKITASRGKYTRAEPVAALYEQGLIAHVGVFHQLEQQCCEWVPGLSSPDRMDALVWALTVLFIHRRGVLYPEVSDASGSEVEARVRPEAYTFEQTVVRDGAWLPRGRG